MPTESNGIHPSGSSCGIARDLTGLLVCCSVLFKVGSGEENARIGVLRRIDASDVRQMNLYWPAIATGCLLL